MKTTSGTTLIEAVIAISLTFLLVIIFGASYVIVNAERSYRFRGLALDLATQEIETLRDIPFNKLANQTAEDFFGVPYNLGIWQVTAEADAPSAPLTLRIVKSGSLPSGLTGIANVPGYSYDSPSFEIMFKVSTNSPEDWKTGVALRLQDENNAYLVTASGNALEVYKNVSGTLTQLASTPMTFSKDTWYKLKATANDNTINAYINDLLKLTATDVDSTFSSGTLALITQGGASASFDNIVAAEAGSPSWNFDTDKIGEMPAEWFRLGLHDLPTGIAQLTIASYNDLYDDLKEITARVQWVEGDRTNFVEVKSLIAEH